MKTFSEAGNRLVSALCWYCFYVDVLPMVWACGKCGIDHEPGVAGCHYVGLRRYANATGHCWNRFDCGHGGGRQRADFFRIREELKIIPRNGQFAGFDRALLTITDQCHDILCRNHSALYR